MYKEILLLGSLALSFQGVCSTQITDLVNPSGDASPTTQKIFGVPTPMSTEVVDLNSSDLPLQLVRERPKLILTYDQAAEDNYKTDFGGDLVAALHREMTSVNQVFVNSGSDVQFDWMVIKSDTEFQATPILFDVDALAGQQWYKDFQMGNLADAVVGVVATELRPGGQCVLATRYSRYDKPSLNDLPNHQRFAPCVIGVGALDSTVLAHELGHWLGSLHDRYQEENYGLGTTDYWPGYGYVNLDNGFMTIMSYASECIDTNVECKKIPLFSNPKLSHNGLSAGKDSSNIDAADNVSLFSYTHQDFLAKKSLYTDIYSDVTTDKIQLSWQDIRTRYQVQVIDSQGYVTESYTVTEPQITINRPFFEYAGREGHNYTSKVVINSIYQLNDIARLIPIGETALRARYEDYYYKTGKTIIQDGQIGLSSSFVSLPDKGESVTVTLTVMDETIANSDFRLASDAAPCYVGFNEEQESYCWGISRRVINADFDYLNDPFYGDRDPDWLNTIFDYNFTGEGKTRTLTMTSKWSHQDWQDYFGRLFLDEELIYSVPGGFDYEDSYFINKRLPIAILRTGEDDISIDNDSLVILGEALVNFDLSDLLSTELEIDSKAVPFSKMSFRQNIPNSATPANAPSFYSSSPLAYASTDADVTSETAVLSKALSGTIVKVDVYGPEFDNFQLDSTIPWTRISRNVFSLNLTGVESGVHTVNIVTASTSATSPAGDVIGSGEIIVADTLPELSELNDTDNDGHSDAFEGFKDTDSDGIVDYLDPLSSNNNTLKGLGGLPIIEPVEALYAQQLAEEGSSLKFTRTLSLPSRILQAKQGVSDSAVMTWEQLQSIYSNQSIDEQGYTPYTDIIDVNYHINNHDLTLDWGAELVVTLPEDNPIKENSEFRVIDSQGLWTEFTDGRGYPNVFSGLSVDGQCSINIDDYSAGLIPGNNCLYLTYFKPSPDTPPTFIEFGPGALMVKNVAEVANHAPTVSIGAPAGSYDEGVNVSLSADAVDQDGDTLTYQWTQLSGTGVSLSSTNSATVNFMVPEVSSDEIIELQLVVSDGELEAKSIVSFKAINIPTAVTPPDTNKPEDNSSGGGSMGWLVLFAGVIYAGRSNKRKLAA
jgi:hypothetical protein